MQTALQFGPVLVHLDLLLRGLEKTIQLAALSILFGTLIGIFGAVGRSYGPRVLSWPIAWYVELIRNTPLLIQLYFVFFSLPLFGFKLSSSTAAIVALSIHLGAYATEILRAGIEAIPKGRSRLPNRWGSAATGSSATSCWCRRRVLFTRRSRRNSSCRSWEPRSSAPSPRKS
nr:ABC transporter permease subunit [Mesorhizobium sp.]